MLFPLVINFSIICLKNALGSTPDVSFIAFVQSFFFSSANLISNYTRKAELVEHIEKFFLADVPSFGKIILSNSAVRDKKISSPFAKLLIICFLYSLNF